MRCTSQRCGFASHWSHHVCVRVRVYRAVRCERNSSYHRHESYQHITRETTRIQSACLDKCAKSEVWIPFRTERLIGVQMTDWFSHIRRKRHISSNRVRHIIGVNTLESINTTERSYWRTICLSCKSSRVRTQATVPRERSDAITGVAMRSVHPTETAARVWRDVKVTYTFIYNAGTHTTSQFLPNPTDVFARACERARQAHAHTEREVKVR